MEFKTVDEILDFAIQEEENAAAFYTDLAGQMDLPHMKEAFLSFADEEKGHKAKLVAIKQGEQLMPVRERVLDLKVGDYLPDIDLDSKLDYQQALTVAMKAEKTAFRLYSDLASATDDATLKKILLTLAQEEAKHKLRFEIEYDDHVLKEH